MGPNGIKYLEVLYYIALTMCYNIEVITFEGDNRVVWVLNREMSV